MRNNRKSNGAGTICYDKSTGKWRGSMLLRFDENTEQQLRKTIVANSKNELIEGINHFRNTIPPVFTY